MAWQQQASAIIKAQGMSLVSAVTLIGAVTQGMLITEGYAEVLPPHLGFVGELTLKV